MTYIYHSRLCKLDKLFSINYPFIILTILLLSGPANASEAIDQITAQVETKIISLFAEHMPNFDQSKLQINYDNALQLFNQPMCEKTLAFERINSLPLGRKTILVRCKDAHSWAIYLPIKVAYIQPVVMTRGSLSTKDILVQSDVIIAERDIGQIRSGYYTNIADVLNMSTRRNLKPGVILNSGLLQSPEVIQRGDSVTIIAKSNWLQVRVTGTAMTSGRIGKQIQIKNEKSGKIVKARVISSGIVEVVI